MKATTFILLSVTLVLLSCTVFTGQSKVCGSIVLSVFGRGAYNIFTSDVTFTNVETGNKYKVRFEHNSPTFPAITVDQMVPGRYNVVFDPVDLKAGYSFEGITIKSGMLTLAAMDVHFTTGSGVDYEESFIDINAKNIRTRLSVKADTVALNKNIRMDLGRPNAYQWLLDQNMVNAQICVTGIEEHCLYAKNLDKEFYFELLPGKYRVTATGIGNFQSNYHIITVYPLKNSE